MDDEARYRLGETLERSARKLQSRLRGHFVDDKSVCLSCKHAQVMRRGSKNSRVIYCSSLSQYAPNDIAECSDWGSVTSLSISQMTDVAILIELENRSVGFKKEQ